MSVRIKVSYETEEELKRVLKLLDPVVKNWTRAAKKNGRFFRIYIMLDDKKYNIKGLFHTRFGYVGPCFMHENSI